MHAAAPAWKPDQNVEIIVGPAGGGSDANARLIQRLAREKRLVETPLIVVNKAGGQGTVGFTYLGQQTGSGHHLMITSPTLLTNYIIGRQAINYTDVTPLAMIGAEYGVFARQVQQDEWKRDAEANLVENAFMGSADTRRLMDTQYAELGRVLRALDLAKMP